MKTGFIIIFVIASVFVLFVMYKSGHLFKSAVTSIFQGVTSMLAVNVIGLLTGVTISVNWYTLAAVSLFGIPSTITLVLLDAFLI